MAVTTRFSAAGDSDLGCVRQNNEDRFFIDPELGIFIVVDGVGGHAAGEQAAAIAIDSLYTRLRRQMGSIESRIREAITLANNEIFDRAQANEEWRGMACVLTVAVVDGASLIVGHVGDTRLYKIHRGAIQKVTPDHSPVGAREDANELTEIEAMNHPRRNEVFRDVGTEKHDTHDEGFIEIIKAPFEPDSPWVMCSDGLSDLVTSWQIQQTVESCAGDLSTVVRYLIDSANEAGGKDNITVLYVEGEEFERAVKQSNSLVISDANRSYEGETTQFASDPNARFLRKQEPGAAPAMMAAGGRDENPPQAKQQAMQLQSSRPATYNRSYEAEERAGASSLLLSRASLFVYGFLLAIASLLVFHLAFGISLIPEKEGQTPAGPRRLAVGPGREFQKISEAIEAANPGDAIEVEPGIYRERISLDGKENISITSRFPHQALIYSLQEGSEGGIAVSIANTGSGRFSGFKILGDEKQPLSVGIRINASSVEISDNEIANIDRAGVEITAPGEAILRGNYIHDYQGVGIHISGEARPILERNAIAHKQQAGRAGKPAIQISQKEMPVLRWNTIYKADNISGVEDSAKNELLKNNFLIPNGESVERENQPQAQRQPRRR